VEWGGREWPADGAFAPHPPHIHYFSSRELPGRVSIVAAMSEDQPTVVGEVRLEEEAVASLVKARDRERYWAALFAPASVRPGLLALYAFSTELQHIATAVREPMVAQIRLQWWRDAIDLAAPGMKTGNPLADALAGAILAYDLPRERLAAMAAARIPEINGDAPAGLPDLRSSLQETEGAVFELAAAILGDASEAAKEAAQRAGLAYGLTHRLRTFAVQASRRRLLLPPSYLKSRGADTDWLYAGKPSAALAAALADFREEAGRELQQFRDLRSTLDRAAWPAFLPLALVEPYLKAMAASSFEPLQTVATLNPLRQYWRIWRAAFLGAV